MTIVLSRNNTIKLDGRTIGTWRAEYPRDKYANHRGMVKVIYKALLSGYTRDKEIIGYTLRDLRDDLTTHVAKYRQDLIK